MSWEEAETGKKRGSTAFIPCGAAGAMCQLDLVIVGHLVPLHGKVCFSTLGMVCGKVSVLTVFSEKVQVFPAY